MLQHTFSGPTSQDFLMSLTPSSLANLANYSSTLSVLLNEDGGIIDDTIITKHSDDSFYVVTNAGRATEDKAHIEAKLQEWNANNKGKEVKWETMDGWGLVALQGPKAAEVLQGMVDLDLSTIKFGQGAHVDIDGARCHIARGGYTGEDGFEVRPSESCHLNADDRSRYPPSRLLRSPRRLPATRMSSSLDWALETVYV
jgi:aminomethyltransferase